MRTEGKFTVTDDEGTILMEMDLCKKIRFCCTCSNMDDDGYQCELYGITWEEPSNPRNCRACEDYHKRKYPTKRRWVLNDKEEK